MLPGRTATLELAASAVRRPVWAVDPRVRDVGVSAVYGSALHHALPTPVDAPNAVDGRGELVAANII